MKTNIAKFVVRLLCFSVIVMICKSEVKSADNIVPDVAFAVFILDYETYTIKNCYEFSQPYHKSLPDDGYIQKGKISYDFLPTSDYGYIKVKSILTGEVIVFIEGWWGGGYTHTYPGDSLSLKNYEYGYSNALPDTIISLFETSDQADSAWYAVKNTDVISRLASSDSYEVVLFPMYYNAGVIDGDPFTSEWIVIVLTCPDAPKDMAFIGYAWPQKVITKGIEVIPQILLHNFGSVAEDINVKLTVSGNSFIAYESIKSSGIVPADSSQKILFDSMTIVQQGEYEITFNLLEKKGLPREDLFPENDIWQQNIKCTIQPVFKLCLPGEPLYNIPKNGYIFDFDNDNDWDIFQYERNPKLLRCDDGKYFDITEQLDVKLPINARLAIAEDMNCDRFQDLLIIYDGKPLVFLLGDGAGMFFDYSVESGLSGIIGNGGGIFFDKDNDGDPDLILKSYEQDTILENNGKGFFTDVTIQSGIDDPFQTSAISGGDLNNDGYVDLVFSNWDEPSAVFINNGDGHFSQLETDWSFIYARMSVIFDFDGDSFNDIIFAIHGSGNKSLLFKNLGNLQFREMDSVDLSPAFIAEVADFNGDNMLDIILDDLDKSSLLINQGNEFIDGTELLVDISEKFSGKIGCPQFIDLDGDGDLDIYSRSAVFENLGFIPINTSIETISVKQLPYYPILNYPNPFNPTTTIEFSIPSSGFTSLVIYNIMGQKVRELVADKMSAGTHSVVWNGKDDNSNEVSSGIYISKLKMGKHTSSGRMLIMK